MTNLKVTQALDHVQLGERTQLKAINRTNFPDTAALHDVLMRVEALPAGVPISISLDALWSRVKKEAEGRDVVAFMLSERDESGRAQVALLWADQLSTLQLPSGEVTLEAKSNLGPISLKGKAVHQLDVQEAGDYSFGKWSDFPVTGAPGYSIQGASRDGAQPIFTVTEGSTHPTNFVSAAALLWFEHHGGELEKRYPEAWMRAEAFRWCLQKSATPANLTVPELKQQFGSIGILNAEALLKTPLPEREVLTDRRSLTASP